MARDRRTPHRIPQRTLRVGLALVVAVVVFAAPAAGAERPAPADAGGATVRVIVQTASGVDPASVATRAAPSARLRAGHVFTAAVTGFSAEVSLQDLARLRSDPSVVAVELDGRVTIADTEAPTPSWGLDRVDQRELPLDDSYSYDTTGAGVKAYVVDTGVRSTHDEFTGRIVPGYSPIGGGTEDCNGHGTHVAGTIAGTVHGIAKQATVVPIRVLDCGGSGWWSDVIAGIDWAVADHTGGGAVLNMSLSGGGSSAVDAAVQRATDDGITVVVAAGNSNRDACRYSPARAASALTVGATTITDFRAGYSNYGKCLDIFAPGSSITSAWIGSDTATATISGTSMASPHVAGVAARFLGANPGASADDVDAALAAAATAGAVANRGKNSPNLLLYAAPGPVAPPVPTAPDAPPTVTAVAGDGAATVSWTTPADGGAAISGYWVTTNSLGGGATPSPNPSFVGLVNEVTIPGLTNGEAYSFSVAAENAVGIGAAETSNVVTPQDASAVTVPGAPTDVVAAPGRKSADLTWAAPADGGSPILGYHIEVYQQGSLKKTVTVGPETSATVHGLKGKKPHYFVVSAFNAVGEGPGTQSNTVAPT